MDIIYTGEYILLFEADCINMVHIERNKAPPGQSGEGKTIRKTEDESINKSIITNDTIERHRLIAKPEGQETTGTKGSLNLK
jgi:hypothetical protein